jgi:hypothetical protein
VCTERIRGNAAGKVVGELVIQRAPFLPVGWFRTDEHRQDPT